MACTSFGQKKKKKKEEEEKRNEKSAYTILKNNQIHVLILWNDLYCQLTQY
jgi:hypothetical protein